MVYSRTSDDEGTSFREIVLGYLNKIMDLNLKGDVDDVLKYVKSYRIAVLGLNDILIPFFDKEMEEAYKKYKEDYKKIKETLEGNIIRDKEKYIKISINTSRYLFRELNKLLHRNDYLKSHVYGESSDELIIGDDEELGINPEDSAEETTSEI